MSNTNNHPISISSEIPDQVYSEMREYLKRHPGWDADRLVTSAIALFLLQNGHGLDQQDYRGAARTYLETLFGEAA